jgi:hypothetical protein
VLSKASGKMSVFLDLYYMWMNPLSKAWVVISCLLIHPSRIVGFNVSTSGTLHKSMSDAKHTPADHENSGRSSSSYDDASPLHFHGLAVTQTQTQVASRPKEKSRSGTELESRVRIYLLLHCLFCSPLCVPTSFEHC